MVEALVMPGVVSPAVALADAAGRGLAQYQRRPVVWELESFQDGVGPVYSATHRVLVPEPGWPRARAGRLVLTQGSSARMPRTSGRRRGGVPVKVEHPVG